MVVVVVVMVVASSFQAQDVRGGVANLSMPASWRHSGVVVVMLRGL